MAQATARSSRSAAAKTGSTRSRSTSARAGAAQAANEHGMARMTDETSKVLANVTSGPVQTSAPAPASQAPAPAEDLTARANAIVQQGERDKAIAEGKLDMDMSRISHKAIVAEVAMASGTFKTAINLEVAACLAVYWQAKGVNVGSKKELYSVYSDAGYDCAVGGKGKDYKTVNRRIGYIGKLFETLPENTIDGIVGDKTESAALQSLVSWASEKYNFRSMNDVLTAAGVEPPSVAQYKRLSDLNLMVLDTQMKGELFDQPSGDGGAGAGPQTGGGSAPQGGQPPAGPSGGGAAPTEPQGQQQPTAATGGVAAAVQQAGEQRQATTAQAPDPFADTSKWVKVTFEGATLICPVDMRTECLADLGIKLMTLANHMGSEKVDAAKLAEAFKEVAHH